MSQHDLQITPSDANTGISFRAEVNAALQALGSNQSGSSAPSLTYAFQTWVNSNSDPAVVNMRNATNTAWIVIGYINTSTGQYIPANLTKTYIDSLGIAAGNVTKAVIDALGVNAATCSQVTKTYIDGLGINAATVNGVVGVASGCVQAFAGSSVPSGWLECNGTAVSRTTYATLFSVINTIYGSGNGSTTFNLPDLRGEFIRGWDHSRGVDAGRNIGTAQADDIEAHTHSLEASYGNTWQAGPSAGNYYGIDSADTTGSTGGSETRPRNIAMMYIIKT